MPKFSPEEIKALPTHSLEKALDAARTKYFDMDDSDPTALKIAKDIFKMFDAEMSRRESFNIHENPADADPLPIDDDYEPQTIIHKSDPALIRTVDEKVEWLKAEVNMDLSHDNPQELEIFANLAIEHKAKSQREYQFLAKIINSFEKVASGKTTPLSDSMDRHSEKYPSFARIASNLLLDPSSALLMTRRKGKNPQMVVPNSLQRYYVHSAHDNPAPDGRQHVSACLDDFCWEFRDQFGRSRKPTCLFISNLLLIRHYLPPALPMSYFISSARKMPSVPPSTSTRAHPGHVLTYLSDNPTDLAPAAYSIKCTCLFTFAFVTELICLLLAHLFTPTSNTGLQRLFISLQ